MRRLVVLALLIGLAAAATYVWREGFETRASAQAPYRTQALERGALVASVRATGTLNPLSTVLVGSQLSGQVVEVLADFNARVTSGQVVARLDASQIRARHEAAAAELAQAQADLSVRRARLARAEATRAKADATLRDVEAQRKRVEAQLADVRRTLERQRELLERRVGTKVAVDTAQTQVDLQLAALASSDAQIASVRAELLGLDADIALAKAEILASEAAIKGRKAKLDDIAIDLGRAEIRSPVDGVIVSKSVELGQTVAASLQAPVLFTIAQDLREIEIAANIDEADIGRIREGQRVSFTVNAYPGRNFEGLVKQRRLGAQTIQNVVIYTVVISVRNEDLALLPGMTANVQIVTEERRDALKVTNAALRWRPPGVAPPATAETAAPPPGAGFQGAPRGQRGRLQEMLSAIEREVKPTAEEMTAIRDILRDSGQRFRDAAGEGLAREEQRSRMRDIRRDIARQIGEALAPERRAAYRAYLEKAAAQQQEADQRGGGSPGRLYIVGADGQPQEVRLRVGVTDGSVTEIVSGDIAADARVIVGGGPRTAPAATPAGQPPRFRMF